MTEVSLSGCRMQLAQSKKGLRCEPWNEFQTYQNHTSCVDIFQSSALGEIEHHLQFWGCETKREVTCIGKRKKFSVCISYFFQTVASASSPTFFNFISCHFHCKFQVISYSNFTANMSAVKQLSMAGFGRAFDAAMLQPVNQLSDDDLEGEEVPMKKPAARETPTKIPGPAPKRKGVLRKPPSPEPKPTPKKKPAANKREMKLSKYFYKKDGTWGFKINQKQVMLAPRLQRVRLQLKFQQQWIVFQKQDVVLKPSPFSGKACRRSFCWDFGRYRRILVSSLYIKINFEWSPTVGNYFEWSTAVGGSMHKTCQGGSEERTGSHRRRCGSGIGSESY